MKRFLWFNINKLKTDCDYFLVTYISLILIQFEFYISLSELKLYDLVFAMIFTIFFVYITFLKKEFTLMDAIKHIWKVD